ncbi:phage tail protein [Pseudomonas sp. Irchel s3b2]|uniref:phage tail protein n=1 Tax=Pseudomonas sp. Irchel s3b2 TaxID=2009073 RepID=UPI000BA4800E|nr:phage tail protein [Pseudomonas sp. Irchel s3b2]
MLKLSLPFWLDGPELAKLKAAAQVWWEKVTDWLRWPLLQLDAETCHLSVLDMLAWQRDITRFRGEQEDLYRIRVKYAFINAVDGGSTSGLKRIFERLGVGYVEIKERIAGRDWDVIELHLTESQLSKNPELLRVLAQQYGRTCRRYEFVSITPLSLHLQCLEFNDDQQTFGASILPQDLTDIDELNRSVARAYYFTHVELAEFLGTL